MDPLSKLIKGNLGSTVISLSTLDSTNTFAMELGEKGGAHGTVVLAESQTKGRGRLGRPWVSCPGRNILMSVILRPALESGSQTLLSMMAGVAGAEALREASGLQVAIKWPNDLMVSGRKLGGILVETRSAQGKMHFAVIGMGINVNSEENDFPPDVREIATSMKIETGREYPRTVLTAAILNEMEYWYHMVLMSKGRGPILRRWRDLTATLGKAVRVAVGDETFTGIAEDIDKEGMLLVRLPSGSIRTINAGDVTLLR